MAYARARTGPSGSIHRVACSSRSGPGRGGGRVSLAGYLHKTRRIERVGQEGRREAFLRAVINRCHLRARAHAGCAHKFGWRSSRAHERIIHHRTYCREACARHASEFVGIIRARYRAAPRADSLLSFLPPGGLKRKRGNEKERGEIDGKGMKERESSLIWVRINMPVPGYKTAEISLIHFARRHVCRKGEMKSGRKLSVWWNALILGKEREAVVKLRRAKSDLFS